ncbi:GPP34 family phosphoprotein [Streptodolium elevatio]|uniref:GPP34 family phosphoprotein n=1 Tax=Streptodolium elevatio TaxID=3157996 RepID=A0ABV3DNS1_9ACTN
MTTARDLIITAMDEAERREAGQGELSLALAGAELVDLLAASAVTLDGDAIVPAGTPAFDDPLLEQSAAAVVRQKPYESVEYWLWRRGRDLAAAYAAALAEEGSLAHRRGRSPLGTGRVAVADSADHRAARDRWAAHEPVLTALATSAGLRDKPDDEPPAPPRDPVGIVLAAVEDAVTELEAVRQRRAIEQAAYDNIWRAP